MAATGAELVPGFDIVADVAGLDAKIQAADLVITGEGKLDSQSAAGKGPVQVAQWARRLGKPCVAIAGHIDEDADPSGELFAGAFSLTQMAGSSAAAMAEPERWLKATVAAARSQILQLARRG